MDQVIYHRVAVILLEMGLHSPISFIDNFDPGICIRNVEEHRLYEFQVEIRDDVDPDNFIRGVLHCYAAVQRAQQRQG